MEKVISRKKTKEIRLSKKTTGVIAGIATFGALVASSKTAHADNTQEDVSSTVATSNEQTKSTPDNSGIEVSVDHSDLDNSINNAKNAGVTVTEEPQTETQVVDSSKAQETHDQIVADYKQQQQNIDDATNKQIEKNNSFNEKVQDAQITNQEAEQQINQAVENAKNAGLVVTHNEQSDQITSTNIDNYENAKADVKKANEDTLSSLNTATAEYNANKAVESVQNDTSVINEAVKNAQNVLGNDKVNKTAPVNYGEVTINNASNLSEKIKKDYLDQASTINQTVQTYQDAVNAAGSINRKELDDAVKNAQSVLGNDHVKQEQTLEKVSTMENTSSAVDEANRDYQDQADRINKAVSDYQKEYSDYERQMNEYRSKLNSSQISSNDILQRLTLGDEPDAVATIDSVSSNVDLSTDLSVDEADKFTAGNHAGYTQHNIAVIAKNSGANLDGDIIKVTYSNLQNSYYGDRKISKIIATYKDAENNTAPGGAGGSQKTYLLIWSNPANAFWYGNSKKVRVAYDYYDENNNRISLENEADGGGAWITVGSLNSGGNRTEGVRLLSEGRAYGFLNSPVEAHGKWLYSDYANDNSDADVISASGKGLSTLINSENEKWDGTLSSPLAYLGAGVFNVTGDTLELEYTTERSDSTKNDGNVTWATISTTIVKDDSGIKIPSKPEINYHFNSVTVEKPSVEYHDAIVELKPRDGEINYSYKKLAVEKPVAETANYKYHSYKVVGTSTKSASQVTNGSDKNIAEKTVTRGDIVTYTIETTPLPADRIEEQTSYKVVDKLPKGEIFKDFRVYDASGKGITSDFISNYDSKTNTVTIVTKDGAEIVAEMNNNKHQQFLMPKVIIDTTVTEDGAKLENTAETYLNEVKTSTNTTVNNVSKPSPEKTQFVNGQEANEKSLIANDVIEYKISWDLSTLTNASLSDDQIKKGMTLFDDYDPHTTAIKDSLVVVDTSGNSISDLSVDWDDQNTSLLISVNDVQAFLDKYAGQKLTVSFNAKVVTEFEGDVNNQAAQNDFGNTYKTNIVTAKVSRPTPEKDVVANVGDANSLNNSDVKLGDYLTYKLKSKKLPANRATNVDSWAQKDIIDTVHDSVTGLWVTFIDQDLVKSDGSIISAGTDISDLMEFVYKDGVVKVSPRDEFKALINSDANRSHELSYTTYFGVKRIASGFVYNSFDDALNQVSDESNEVWTFTYTPVDPKSHKKVTVGTTEDVNASDDNNVKVLKGETLSFILSADDLPEYHEDISNIQFDESFDSDLAYTGYKALIKNDAGSYVDVSGLFTEIINGQNVKWVAKDELFKLLNVGEKNENQAAFPIIIAYTKVLNDNTDITNEYQLTVNGKVVTSNKTNNPVPGVEPSKEVLNKSDEDINDTNVMVGDSLYYKLTWDLSQLDSIKISDELINKEYSLNDDYDETKIDINKASLSVKDSSNNDVTNLFNVEWDDNAGKFKVTFKDGNRALIDKYEGQKLFVSFIGTPKSGLDDGTEIINTGKQINAGNEYNTQTVKNYVHNPKPVKDIVDNVGSQKSLDNTAIKLGEVKRYKLTSSIRPANYKEKTEQWKLVDKLDPIDQYTGLTEVYSKTDIFDSKGNVIPAGTNITKYFTENFNSQTNTVTIEATEEFKNMLDEYNKGNEIQFDAFIEVKRIDTGVAVNKFTEFFNNVETQSNVVKTPTEVPEIPEEPEKPEVPEVPEEPEKPEVPETPEEPEKPEVPETPEEPEKPEVPETPEEPEKPAESTQVIYRTPNSEVIIPTPIQSNVKEPETELPKLGNSNDSNSVSFVGIILTVFGMLGLARKRKYQGE
ncbi:LPXTG cell wall anchor domain-containing protein [Ligilactobacillus faecis]|uniref:LPXTG cell wall anchor domain-containing protein n=1 Tax=Ligilactobacillus faecis TaxID=762833 RepID=A0ABV4DM22_9LACO